MTARFLAVGALGVLAACSAPPKPTSPKRTAEFASPPLFAVVEPTTGAVFVPLRDRSVARLRLVCVEQPDQENPRRNELEVVTACAPLDAIATCAAADGAGRIAIGLNNGSAHLYDATRAPWTKLAELLAVGARPVAAIGVLTTATAPDATLDADQAWAAMTAAAPTKAFDALLALYPRRLRWMQSQGGADGNLKPTLSSPAMPRGSEQEQHGIVHFDAVASDPIGRRWFLLADGAVHAVDAAAAPKDFAPQRRCDARGAVAMAWSGRRLVLAGDTGLQWVDPATAQATPVPGSESARYVHVVADDALGVVAAIDENERVALWQNDGGTWRMKPVAAAMAARALAIVDPDRAMPGSGKLAIGLGPQLFVLGASDDLGRGVVQFFDLAPPPVAAP